MLLFCGKARIGLACDGVEGMMGRGGMCKVEIIEKKVLYEQYFDA